MARLHAPSAARALVQEARRPGGRPLGELMTAARALPDPGHAAETLATLAAEPDAPAQDARQARADACDLAAKVPREWRRAEVLTTIAQTVAHAAPEARAEVEDRIAALARDFAAGEARSQLVADLAPHAGPRLLPVLFDLAATNGTNPWDDVRAVVRAWMDHEGADEATLMARVRAIEHPPLRARILAYVDRRGPGGDGDALDAALDALAEVGDPAEAADPWRAVIQKATDVEALTRIHARLTEADPHLRVALLPALVGRAYREDDDPCALAWHDETLATLPRVAEPVPRLRALVNLAKAHARAGHDERLTDTVRQAEHVLASVPDPLHTTWARKLEQATGGQAGEPRGTTKPLKHEPAATATPAPPSALAPAAPGRGTTPSRAPRPAAALRHHALALQDTYSGGLKAAHLRAVARAAPLCEAFDLALVLFDFPVADLDALVARLEAETNVGEGRGSLRRLVADDRVRLVATSGAPPRDWTPLGVPVATTPHPAAGRRADLDAAVASGAAHGVPEGRLCLVMGLGRQGLPQRWLDAIDAHYEITGRDVSLETATAMGILAERLRALGPPGGARTPSAGPRGPGGGRAVPRGRGRGPRRS